MGSEGVLVLQIEAPVLDEPRGAVPLEYETEVGAGVAVTAKGAAWPFVIYGWIVAGGAVGGVAVDDDEIGDEAWVGRGVPSCQSLPTWKA